MKEEEPIQPSAILPLSELRTSAELRTSTELTPSAELRPLAELRSPADANNSIPSFHYRPHHMSFADIEDLRQLIAGRLVEGPVFELALTRAVQTGVPVDGLLIQEGLMDETAYLMTLAAEVGLEFIGAERASELIVQFEDRERLNQRFSPISMATSDGLAIVPFGLGPTSLRAEINTLINAGHLAGDGDNNYAYEAPRKLYITSASLLRDVFMSRYAQQLTLTAKDGLSSVTPIDCAKGGLSGAQRLGVLVLGFLATYGVWVDYQMAGFVISAFFSVFFFFLISLRLVTALNYNKISALFSKRPSPLNNMAGSEQGLPVYTILVPLFRETAVLSQLIASLNELDYPKSKLDIKLLLEEVDGQTIEKVKSLRLPPYFQVVIVPDSFPRTKPKALNYGLQLAQGSFIVIYDAEDIPEPDQLRRALIRFSETGPQVATLQAKLNFYNQHQNWMTKQFTIEYSSLFDGLLPSYFHLDIPLPLGGTSNHFKREILEHVGAWDPYNVTEDADLGMRLYRRGYQSSILASTTYEEACFGFKNWFYQRTRWLKGWMQTYFVHMRRPIKLWKDFGTWRFLGFQAIIGGPIFAAIVHPVFLGILIWQMPFDELPSSLPMTGLWMLSLFNLGAGYLVTMWLGVKALRFRNLSGFGFAILTVPLYWLMISFASYRALFQLFYAPFHWDKTEHSGQNSQKSSVNF